MTFTAAFEMMSVTANGMCVESGGFAFVGSFWKCGLRRGDCRWLGVVAGIGITVPSMLFLFCHIWVRVLVHSVRLFVIFVYVVTGGAVEILWASCSPSEMGVASNLWFDWASVSVEISPSTVALCFRILDLEIGFLLWIESINSSYTSFACWSGVN